MGVCVSIPSWTDLNIPCLDIPFFLLSVLEISIAAGFFELMQSLQVEFLALIIVLYPLLSFMVQHPLGHLSAP